MTEDLKKTEDVVEALGDCMARISSTAIAFLLVGVLVGVAVGWVAKPIPPPGPDYVLRTDYDRVKSDYDALKPQYDAMKSEYDVLKPAYDKMVAQLAKLKKPAKVGLVMATGGLGDKSYNDISYAGVVQAEEELGIEFDYVEPKAIAEYEGFQRDFAKTGEYAIIICIGFDQADALAKVADEYPNQRFAIVDMVVAKPNVASLLFRSNEGSFLVGVIAGMSTKTGKVGFVGGMDDPLIKDFFMGYEAGVKWVNSSVTVLPAVYVGDWANPTKAKELAVSLVELGADAIYAAAGKSGLGALAAANEKNITAFGVDSCQDYLNPAVLASMTKRVDRAVFEMIVAATFDEVYGIWHAFFKGGFIEGGVKEGWTGCCRLPQEQAFWEAKFNFTHTALPANVVTKLNEARAGIISGEIQVPRPY